jgi:phosphoribosylanthranilate isomerase
MTRVKICGITNLEDARHAIDMGADELGFNFYTGSSRYVNAEEAQAIAYNLSLSARKIGVFVNESLSNVVEISKVVGLDGIQLHGDEDEAYALDLKEQTGLSLIRAFRVSPSFDAATVLDWPATPLLDAYSPGQRGGTGKRLDLDKFEHDIWLQFPNDWYLAGGLTPDNVAEAIETVKPGTVDVASGVEECPRKKDRKKMAAFIKAAKEAL